MREDRKDLRVNMRKHYDFRKGVPRLSQVFGFLREQEEDKAKDSGGDDASTDDLFGDDAGDDSGDDSGGDDAGGDDTGGSDSGGSGGSGGDESDSGDDATEKDDDKDDKDDKKDKLAISAEDKARLSDSLDDELEGIFVDYETDAREAAAIQSEKLKTESLRSVYRVLYEVAADDIDIKNFAANTARLVKNYDTLIDMNSVILNKAYSYIQNKYGDDTVKALKDVLEQEFDIEVERGPSDEKDEPEIPIAVGATGDGGSGAA